MRFCREFAIFPVIGSHPEALVIHLFQVEDALPFRIANDNFVYRPIIMETDFMGSDADGFHASPCPSV